MSNEAGLQRRLTQFLRSKGCLVYKFSSPSQRGVPDLLVIAPDGFTFFVEVKSPTKLGKLSALQRYTITKMEEHNVKVLVTSDFEAAKTWLKEVLTGRGAECLSRS